LALSLILGLHETAYCGTENTPVNESEIRYENITDLDPQYGGVCKIQNSENIHLEDIGKSKHYIENNYVRCVMADLDGNGYYDFAFWGAFDSKAFWNAKPGKARIELEPLFKILFFEKDRIIGTQILKNHARDHIWLYNPTDKEGDFGEPETELPGLIQSGEGGTTYIYLYDPKTRQLERSNYASEWL
jgi:hypothetical protein